MENELSAMQSLTAFLLYMAPLILSLVASWKIFVKMGRCGWESLIPIYNLVILYKCIWGSGWYVLLLLIPVVGSVIALVSLFKLYRGFHKGLLFSWLGLLFSPIAMLIVAFDSTQWHGEFF